MVKQGDKGSGTAMPVERQLELLRMMLTIRETELRLARLFADGEIPGFIHLSVGQEAIPVGVSSALSAEDTIVSNHRGHGHTLAKGVRLDRFFLEILAREEGCCRGRGGSMHVADSSVGMLGANGIVGAGIPIALGSALAHKLRRTGKVAAVYFGDGALAEGVLHESLNLAALWSLPMIFVCENNGWSEFSPSAEQFRGDLGKLAAAFGIEATTVDGNDVGMVAGTAAAIVAAARAGKGPRVLECQTLRVRGHFEGDQQKYREKTADTLGDADPIVRLETSLRKAGAASSRLDEIRRGVEAKIERALEIARAGTPPSFDRALDEVYAPLEAAQ